MTQKHYDLAAFFAPSRPGILARRLIFDRRARLAALANLRQAVLDWQDDIMAALAADFGKHSVEVRLTEILPIL
jgi:aldehyde dehydrogenase (NAD+)